MKFFKSVALGLAALIVPGLLAVATYWISASSFDTPAGAIPRVSGRIAQPRSEESPRPKSPRAKASPVPTNIDDVSGPCDELQHADDPECTGEDVEDNSGPGGGGDDDNSGPGSDNSGPGSDDSDSSGPGSGDSGDSGGDD